MGRERRLPRCLATSATTRRCTPDPDQPGRFHADIPDAWKVVYIFGGVSMYAALRAMDEAARPRRPLARDRERDLPRAGPARPDHHRRRRAARRPAARRRSRPICASPASTSPALRVHGVFGAAHDTELAHQEVRFPEVPASGRHRDRRPSARTRSARSTSTSRPNGGRSARSTIRARATSCRGCACARASRTCSASRCTATCSVPRSGRALGPPDERGMFMVLSLEIGIRFVRAPVDAVGAAGDRGLAHRRRLRDRPRPPLGRGRQPLRDRHPDRAPAPPPRSTRRS